MTIRFLNDSELNLLLNSNSLLGGTDEHLNSSTNIYKYLQTSELDNQLIKKNKFILKPHQTIPKYYFLNHVNKLILHYSMGSGKTAAAIFIASYYMEMDKRNNFLSLYNNLSTDVNKKSVFVVGAWQTQNAFVQDLIKPEFHFIGIEEMKNIKRKLNSSFKEVKEQGLLEYNKLIKNVARKIHFSGYQAFFNECFPDIDEKRYTQDAELLIKEFNRGTIHISDTFISKLKNTLVIVDEAQKLYSNQGLNSYGFVIAMLCKLPKEYNVKVLLLTGTMLNSSLKEVIDVMNVLNDEKFEDYSTYLEPVTILNDITTYKIRKDKEEYIRNYFKKVFLYYTTQVNNSDKSVIKNFYEEVETPLMFTELDEKNKSIEFKDKLKTISTPTGLKELIFKSKSDYIPDEIHVGNILIKESEQLLNLYSVEVNGFQADKYKKYLSTDVSLSSLTENDESVSIHDGIFDTHDTKLYFTGGIYSGPGLKYPYIKKYSAIGAEVVRLCLYNSVKGEKTVLYHDKILGFGLKQYMEILNQNGFILYGTSPKNDTRCKVCGVEFKDHNSKKHNFVPLRYTGLYGDLTDVERKNITQLYNSPNNLYGDYISVMFISSVAYSGVSFFNTNNIIILNKISNLSKWKQIYSRIIRTHSHDLLPKEKKFSRVYTMIIKHPEETTNGVSKFIYEEKYYRLRTILNSFINEFTLDIYKHSVTDLLLKYPEKINQVDENSNKNKDFNSNEQQNTLTLKFKNEYSQFIQDMITELKFVLKRMRVVENEGWILNNLLTRIQDPHNQLSYINFYKISRKELLSMLIKENFLKIFFISQIGDINYNSKDSSNSRTIYCELFETKQIRHMDHISNTFKFNDLSCLELKSKVSKDTLIELSSLTEKMTSILKSPVINERIMEEYNNRIIKVRNLLDKVIKSIKYDFKQIVHYKCFWDAIYIIHDEYYSDDDKNFVKNHSSKGRSYEQIAGFYYYDSVILRPKDVDLVNNKFPDKEVETIETIKLKRFVPNETKFSVSPYYFKIVTCNNTELTVWYIRIVILDPALFVDKRRQSKGVSCGSFNVEKLLTYFPDVSSTLNRKNFCVKFIETLCDISLKEKVEISNPFSYKK